MTEDHPVGYLKFKGTIPEDNYGAGFMEIWDQGAYFPVDEDMNRISEKQALAALKKGELKLFLKGTHIQGGYVLIRLKPDEKNWLLIKHNDEFNVRKPYDAEKYVPVSRKENAGIATAAKTKSSQKTNIAKKVAGKKGGGPVNTTAKKKAGKTAGKKTVKKS